MQTFYNNKKLHKLFAQFYEAGKASTTICHGSAILLKTKLSNGKLLAEGKKWTGFCNAEEDIVDEGAGKKMQPFRIEATGQAIPKKLFELIPSKKKKISLVGFASLISVL